MAAARHSTGARPSRPAAFHSPIAARDALATGLRVALPVVRPSRPAAFHPKKENGKPQPERSEGSPTDSISMTRANVTEDTVKMGARPYFPSGNGVTHRVSGIVDVTL